MRSHRTVEPGSLGSIIAVLAGLLACSTPGDTPVAPEQMQAAKAGAGPSVTAATPPYGNRGESGKQVTITGSGFAAGDQASWERNGAADPKIQVVSTQFVSSTQLVATINIAVDAEIALYDIAIIRPGRKGGIGTMLFEVTTANILPTLAGPGNNSYAWGINDAGHVVGRSNTYAFFWSSTNGLENLGLGQAMDVDASGQTAVGTTSVGGGAAVMWTGGSANWSSSLLTTACVTGTVSGGTAFSIASDGSRAGGSIRVEISRNKARGRPVIWDLQNGSCTQLARPVTHSDHAHITDVNALGMAVGLASDAGGADRAVVWNSAGVPTLLPGSSGGAQAITSDGTIVVGSNNGRPVFWRWTGTTWSSSVELVGGQCPSQSSGWASDINDAGVVVGKGCEGKPWSWVVAGGVVVSATLLPGLGSKSLGQPSAINNVAPGGPWIAGASADLAVYWRRP